MKIEAGATGRAYVTIRTTEDLSKRDVLHLAREATKMVERIIAAAGGPKGKFGFEGGRSLEASELQGEGERKWTPFYDGERDV
jgi:hypothetical protein